MAAVTLHGGFVILTFLLAFHHCPEVVKGAPVPDIDSVPVVSQIKSFAQWVSGDSAAALKTQEHFMYNNTFPVISQIASAGYAIGGDPERAKQLQIEFVKDMGNVADSIPVVGHIKGGIHYAMGDKEKGEESEKAASHGAGVVIGAIGGGLAGGPAGAIAGGIAGGAAADGIITGGDILAKGKDAKHYGEIAAGEAIVDVVKGKKKITAGQAVDMAMMPISDGLAGLAVNEIGGSITGGNSIAAGERIASGSVKSVPIKGGVIEAGSETETLLPAKSATSDAEAGIRQRKPAMDKQALDNRANQLNPNHQKSGPGRTKGYKGKGTKADLDNHANQLNPNHEASGPVALDRRRVAPGAASSVTNEEARLQATGNQKTAAAPSEAAEPTSVGGKIWAFMKKVGQGALMVGAWLLENVWALAMVIIGLIAFAASIACTLCDICCRCCCNRKKKSGVGFWKKISCCCPKKKNDLSLLVDDSTSIQTDAEPEIEEHTVQENAQTGANERTHLLSIPV